MKNIDLFSINTPEKLYEELNKIDYGIKTLDGKLIHADQPDFQKLYRTTTSKEFNKLRAGVCVGTFVILNQFGSKSMTMNSKHTML